MISTVKKILIVVDERKMGGVSILLEDMMSMIDRKNLKFDILCLHNNGNRLENLPDDVNLIYGTSYFETIDLTLKEVLKTKNISLILKKIRLILSMKTGIIKYRIRRERKKILKDDYDVEIAFKDGFTALFVGFGDCKTKIHWLHYNYRSMNSNAKYKRLFKKILSKFNKIIAVSKGVMDDFNNIYHLEDKCEVINNLVNIDRIKEKVKEEVQIDKNDKLRFISVGRLHKIKGYDRLLEAVSKLEKENLIENVEFKIYGDGPEKENLLLKIDNLGLNEKFKLMGETSNPYSKIINSDLFILSSFFETFGLVIVEAMTLKVPVLATSNSATFELIDNDKNGKIVENSADGLYQGLKFILNNLDVLNKYKKNLENYDYNKNNRIIIKKIEDLFR